MAARCGAALLLALALFGCGTDEAEPSPPCGQVCQDQVALRALRETTKLAYNLTLQGNAVGPQDESTPCPIGGSVRVHGEATSDALQGATYVDLDYEFDFCAYSEFDEEPEENYAIVLQGNLHQEGTLAVQPTATTAVIMSSDDMTIGGTVYDPPLDYLEQGCSVELGQSGNRLSGEFCDRVVGVEL